MRNTGKYIVLCGVSGKYYNDPMPKWYGGETRVKEKERKTGDHLWKLRSSKIKTSWSIIL